MTANVVDRETAEAEVNKWLEKKKVFQSTIDSEKASIEILVEAIQRGILVYNEPDNSFTYTLLHPLGEDSSVATLKFKGRINDTMVQKYMKGVSSTDGDGRLNATIAALTETARGIISGVDSIDKKVCNAIAIFFF